ncbi:hypothetical protein ACDH60_26135 [Pseudomonas ficuserectae]|uniref:Uncharacterized protein n=1 Tax=Pseudomonas amygdali pv. lachrymans TaxID=53707 RepID=A0AB37QZT5_PSEAV|nr:hypothetical protein [Pseudomonas amygdali]KKY52749.1 hypothetical protein AAY85_26895 [Pseudomonas amygdali pv. lachrymans]RMM34627.1 hypothetical protein ALQ79_101668 [Pseudomonas amygdali pv. lachrymans]RMP43715.1 hypothetical protein ALQ26_101966 [Pseudomonas amygdali pv. lachrymans]RMU16064.1 hypothetical protein ALP33_101701 [Pseudomonas amygdali pv. lachrymans]WIO56287.1 hypothetical protein QO021_17085 [Pseudomonas amygdali pv. lachrymans]
MTEIDYEHLTDGAKRRVAAFALSKGLSIAEALEAIAIEFLAMGGPSQMRRPKAKLYQLAPNEGLKRD